MMQRVFRKILWITVCIAGVWPAVDAWAGASGDASTAWVEHLVLGDVDGNGVVDMEDARLVIRFVLGQVDSLPNPGDADATQDGEITLEDALAIAQSVTGISRVVVAGPVHGLPGKAQVGSRVRIEVFEKFFPFKVFGGTVRITSSSTGYDSGDRPLTFEQTGRSLYYHWDTSGLTPASDYEIFVNLAGPGQLNARAGKVQQGEAMVALEAPVFKLLHLARVLDAFAPAPGFPLEFRRVFAQDPVNAPYLGPLGRGWMHNFDAHLTEFTNGQIVFLTPEGQGRWFESNEDGTYAALPGDHGQLFREPSGAFVLLEKDGFLYRFRPDDLHLDFMEDPNGNRITATYNASDELITVTHSSSGQSFLIGYNGQGFISSITDHVGRQTTFSYDPDLPHLLSVTAPGGRVTQYTYSMGQAEATDHRLLSITFPDNATLSYTYNDEGRLTSEERAGGIGRVDYTYDEDGTTTITDAVGSTTIVRVDDDRNPTEVVDPLGHVTLYDYDENFNLTRVTDALGRMHLFDYDDRGNVIQVIDPAGNQFILDYEPQFNQLTMLQDTRNNVTSFSYDGQGNLTQVLYPDGTTEQPTYDAQGLLATKTKRDGVVITYNYDNRGLLLSKNSGSETFTYTYDANSNLANAANATGATNFSYDAIDQLTSVTYPGGRLFSYQYDAVGQRTRMTDPDGKVLDYAYDSASRLTRMTDGSGTVVEYEYDAASRRTRKTLGNGVYATYTY